MQLDAMRRYAKDRGWQIVAEIRDVGSGALDRPKRDELIKAARRKEIDVILVWRLDRWGRSVADLALTLKELHELGVAFVSFTEALDLTTPIGRAMAGLLSVFAEFEREVLRERIRAGMAAARKRGKQFGRPIRIEVHRAEIQRLRAAGQSINSIARTFRAQVFGLSDGALKGERPLSFPLRFFGRHPKRGRIDAGNVRFPTCE
jgi:DNA invertase Pin-like site-specific DNA recombinase